MENNLYEIPCNELIKEYVNKYKNLQEFMDAYMHNKTNLNLNDYYEVASYYYLKEKVLIDKQIGENLETLFADDSYVYGVHRIGRMDHMAFKILNEGLELSNHTSSGIANSDDGFDLNNNITFHTEFSEFLKAVSEGATYKRDDFNYGKSLIVRIPKAKINDPFSLIINNGSRKLLRPEYLYGYVSLKINEELKIEFDELVTHQNRIMATTDVKMKRYDELMAIINSEEYQNYQKAISMGEATIYHPEFDGIEEELALLNEELTNEMASLENSPRPKV